jgi:hypothetical protein
MVLGVPVWVVLYTGMKHNVNGRLKKRSLSYDTADYMYMDYIDPESGEVVLRGKYAHKKKEPPEDGAPLKEQNEKKED